MLEEVDGQADRKAGCPTLTLNGTDHPAHREQGCMIRRYIAWRSRNIRNPVCARSSSGQTWPEAARALAHLPCLCRPVYELLVRGVEVFEEAGDEAQLPVIVVVQDRCGGGQQREQPSRSGLVLPG